MRRGRYRPEPLHSSMSALDCTAQACEALQEAVPAVAFAFLRTCGHVGCEELQSLKFQHRCVLFVVLNSELR
jgi:hypothetical protein